MTILLDPDEHYHVRQYRPNYVTGFTNQVVRDVPLHEILKAPWFQNFRDMPGFWTFQIEPYPSGELIISAKYKDDDCHGEDAFSESWVAGFAVRTSHPMADDWRYKPQDGA